MPWTCFSYEADAPSSIGHHNDPESAPSGPRRMIGTARCSYPADVPEPSGPREMVTTCCFSYTAEAPRRMPAGACFRY